MENTNNLTILGLLLNNLFFIVLGVIVFWFTEGPQLFQTIFTLFSTSDLLFSILIGLGGSFVALIYVLVIVRLDKGHFPNTEGAKMLMQLSENKLIAYVGLALLPAISEEFIFRGVLQYLLTDWLNVWAAVLITSILFMLLHISNQYKGKPYLIFHVFLLGVITGVAFALTESLIAPIIIHFINNFVSVALIRKGYVKIK